MNPKSLYYIPSINRFADKQWVIVHNLHSIFDVWQLDRWKETMCNGKLVDKTGAVWNLYYLDYDEESDMLENISQGQDLGMRMDRMHL